MSLFCVSVFSRLSRLFRDAAALRLEWISIAVLEHWQLTCTLRLCLISALDKCLSLSLFVCWVAFQFVSALFECCLCDHYLGGSFLKWGRAALPALDSR